MNRSPTVTGEAKITLSQKLFRGVNRLNIALVGMPGSGKSTLFQAVSSTAAVTGELSGSQRQYRESLVQIGLDEATIIDLPSIKSLHHIATPELATLKFLLWGDQPAMVSAHEPDMPNAPYKSPDVIIQVIDATALDRHLELTLELCMLGKPMVLALNMMDQAAAKGMHIRCIALSKKLGIPIQSTVAHMGQGISKLFQLAVDTARKQQCPLSQAASSYICEQLKPLGQLLKDHQILTAFNVPHGFLVTQIAANDDFFIQEIHQHFPNFVQPIQELIQVANTNLPRGLQEELHADRHHRASQLFESITRLGAAHDGSGWRYWLDELFLHPRWGIIGSLLVFAVVLFVVFEISAWLDSISSAKLVTALSDWQPQSTVGVIARAVVDGLVGLIGIVIPYMLPLVMLLVALEACGVMHRIAFVVDRVFHQVGLHGGVALPFLLGLGCNVPAISSVARVSSGLERVIASVLITFVPCSARSAVILALAGKYLGGVGVFAIFMATLIVIAVLGQLLTRRFTQQRPGQIQDIPAYSMPEWRNVLNETWARTSDILTIVTPLLVGGSVILALLGHFGGDNLINTVFTPITAWWLGLPAVLGLPILFGVLRKELSLLMIYQALGSFDVGAYMDWVQLTTFLLFLTFYVPCVSTFAVMLKTIGRKNALLSVSISVGVALVVAGVVRIILEGFRYIFL